MNDDNNGNVEMWLWLLLVMQPRNPKTHAILNSCGYNLRRACIRMREGDFPFLSEKDNQRIKTIRLGKVRELQRLCADNGISIVTYDSKSYPKLLRFIDNPPIVFFVQGDILCLEGKQIVSAVGTRKPSEYSVRTAHKLCGSIAKAGSVIVSGLAVGLDTVAHEAALENNGITAGILACGNLVNYPAESKALKEQILQNGGVLISELLPETTTPKGYFQMRNRIISGIADEVIVLEAAQESGAILTANNAFDQRRRVFFVPPHDIMDKRYSGAALLYKNGAAPVFCAKDVIGLFSIMRNIENQFIANETVENNDDSEIAATDNGFQNQHDNPSNSEYIHGTTDVERENSQSAAPKRTVTIPDTFNETEKAIYKVLIKGPADVDAIVARSERYYRDITTALLSLEINGSVTRSAEGVYSII